MIGEIDFFGIFISTLIPCLIIAIVLQLILRFIMRKFDLYKYVWHHSLFDLGTLLVFVGVSVLGLKIINLILS